MQTHRETASQSRARYSHSTCDWSRKGFTFRFSLFTFHRVCLTLKIFGAPVVDVPIALLSTFIVEESNRARYHERPQSFSWTPASIRADFKQRLHMFDKDLELFCAIHGAKPEE
jgi:hypothetical protein